MKRIGILLLMIVITVCGCGKDEQNYDADYKFKQPIKESIIITSKYGNRWGKMHHGLDISGVEKGTSIYSAANGIVDEVGNNEDEGNYIVVKHDEDIYSFYSNLETVAVSKGDKVDNSTIIGIVGKPSQKLLGASGTYLHFGIYKEKTDDSNSIDPCDYIKCD